MHQNYLGQLVLICSPFLAWSSTEFSFHIFLFSWAVVCLQFFCSLFPRFALHSHFVSPVLKVSLPPLYRHEMLRLFALCTYEALQLC